LHKFVSPQKKKKRNNFKSHNLNKRERDEQYQIKKNIFSLILNCINCFVRKIQTLSLSRIIPHHRFHVVFLRPYREPLSAFIQQHASSRLFIRSFCSQKKKAKRIISFLKFSASNALRLLYLCRTHTC